MISQEQDMSDDKLFPPDVGGDKPPKTPDDPVLALENVFANHPGFMRCEAGFVVLHADWPAYPLGHGLRPSIASLAEYPAKTRFWPIDRIDQCTLFVAGDVPKKDPYNEGLFHVAIWDEDLVELTQM